MFCAQVIDWAHSVVGYVEQDDCFFPMLTLKEQLMLVAELVMPPSATDKERFNAVNNVAVCLPL